MKNLLVIPLLIFQFTLLWGQPTTSPTLTAPSSGATVYVGVSQNMTWTAVSGANGYDIEFDPGMSYADLIPTLSPIYSYLPTSGGIGTHQWRVRAKNASGPGPWTSPRTLIVVGAPTSAPTLTNPANGANVTANVATTFTWSSVTNATGYDLQFDSESLKDIASATSFSFVSATLGAHTWKVRAKNPSGVGTWSVSRAFTVISGVPNSAPILSAPSDGGTLYDNVSATFTWSQVSGATSYDLQFDPGMSYESTSNVGVTSVAWTTFTGAHQWRVRARNTSGPGTWSSTRSFTTVGVPAVPALNNPANGATGTFGGTMSFNWGAVTNATSYRIQFDSEAEITVSSTSYSRSFSDLLTHTWRVRAYNPAGYSVYSPSRSFSFVLPAPILSAPSDGGTLYDNVSATFTWSQVSGATSYDLQFDPGMSYESTSNVGVTSVAWTTFTGAHQWRVRARNTSGPGTWSSTRSFTTIGAPAIPSLSAPANGVTIYKGQSTTFSWTNVTNATYYEIQFNSETPVNVGSVTSYNRSISAIGPGAWHVRAGNPAGASLYSSSSTYMVAYAPPTLITPANNAVLSVGTSTTFSWSPITNVTVYDIQFDPGTGYEDIITVGSTSYQYTPQTDAVGNHQWRVRASGSNGVWSSMNSFSVGISTGNINVSITGGIGGFHITRYRSGTSWIPVDSKNTNSSGMATWTGIDAGAYMFEGYDDRQTSIWGSPAFWGGQTATVNGNQTASATIIRTEPLLSALLISNKSKPGQILSPGDIAHIDVTVLNPGNIAKIAKCRLLIDRNQSIPWDFDVTHENPIINPGQEAYFGYDYTIPIGTPNGSLSISAAVLTEIEAKWTLTDTKGWNYNIQVESSISTIQFSGYTWTVRGGSGNPGDNLWNNSTNNVWVDPQGYLHLKIRKVGNSWYCSEIYMQQSLGYGDYIFNVSTNVENLDKNVVFGMFTYENDTREIDLEFSRWGNANSPVGWYIVQPSGENSKYNFALNLTGEYSTQKFRWRSSEIFFQSMHGHYLDLPSPDNLIKQWTYSGSQIPPVGSERLHINLWLDNGSAPTDLQDVEVVIKSFTFRKDESPSISNITESSVTATTATIGATISPRGLPTTTWIEYGLDTGYGSKTSDQYVGDGIGNVNVTFNLSGLTPATTYYYHVVAQNTFSKTSGMDQNFTTPSSTQIAYGTTVLVHGYNAGGDFNPISDCWHETIMGLLQRYGKGKVYFYDRTDGTFKQDVRSEFIPYADTYGEIILVHNWGIASNDVVSGHAEAAAEALFAAMIKSKFVDIVHPTSNNSFHFIGHSRGTSVISEVVQRMGVFNIPVSYVTNLDPHDFAEIDVPYDTYFVDPAVQVWNNTLYADNFWQYSILTVVPSGRELGQLISSSYEYNYSLTNLKDFFQLDNTHGRVIDWYLGTILPGTQIEDWYTDQTGNNVGFSLWISRGGHAYNGVINGFRMAVPRTDPKDLTNLVAYTPAGFEDVDDNFAAPYIFNGSFNLPNVTHSIIDPLGEVVTFGGELAGWSYFGGGGNGHVDNGHLELDRGNLSRTHNRFFVPPNAKAIVFKMKVANASSGDPGSTDKFMAVISNSTADYPVIDNVWLNRTSDWETKRIDVTQHANSIITLMFQIVPDGITGSEVWIDDVAFEFGTPPESQKPLVHLNTLSGNWYSTNPLLNIDFDDNIALNNIWYQIGSNSDANSSAWHVLTSDGVSMLPGSQDNTGTSLAIDWKISTADWNSLTATVQNGGKYYIYFKVTDDAGNVYITPEQASAFCLGKDNQPPLVSFSSPEENQTLNTVTVDVRWTTSDVFGSVQLSGIDKIYYAVDQNTNFIEVASSVASVTLSDLTNASHTVYLKASDKAGNMSAVKQLHFSVNTNINPPRSFSLVGPSDKFEIITRRPTFSWNASTDPDGTPVKYTLTYADNGGYQNSVSITDITGTQYQLTQDLTDHTMYFWKVKAVDGANQTRTSTELNWSFTVNTQNDSPTAFALSQPANGSENLGTTPTLSWNPSTDADPNDVITYTVRIGTDANFIDGSYTEYPGQASPSFTLQTPLQNGTYYWCVKAVDNHGALTWSANLNWSFAVGPRTVVHAHTLSPSWNIISSYLTPANSSMQQILNPLVNTGSIIKMQDENGYAVENLPGIGWVYNITNWQTTKGYYLKVTSASIFSITGTPIALPITLSLNPGWNIIGYPRSEPSNALNALQSLISGGKLVKVQDEAGYAIENLPNIGWISNIGSFTPGHGYYIKLNAQGSLTFGPGGTSGKIIATNIAGGLSKHYPPVPEGNPYAPMNIYIQIQSGSDLTTKCEFGVFDGGVCVGASAVRQENIDAGFLPVVVHMDDPTTSEVDGYTEGHSITLQVWDGTVGYAVPVKVVSLTDNEPQSMAFNAHGTIVFKLIPSRLSDLSNFSGPILLDSYPNPFNPSTTMSYYVTSPTAVSLVIYNVLGQRIKTLAEGFATGGFHSVVWDGRNDQGAMQTSGVYLVRFTTAGYVMTKKLMFTK